MLINVAVAVSLLAAYSVFFLVGIYGESRAVVRVPERGLRYSLAELREIAADEREYVVPILFPLDLIVMLLLSASLAFAGLYWGWQLIDAANSWMLLRSHSISIHPAWALLPAVAYLVADLLEDSLLALLLTYRLPIGIGTVLPLKTLTALKLVAIFIAYFVAAGGFAVVAYRYFSG